MPFPNPDTQFKKGQSGFAGRKHTRPDIEALNKLIAEMEVEPGIARTWLAEALGQKETIVETIHPDGTITKKITRERVPANVPLLRMLVEYRNGKVPQPVEVKQDNGTSEDTQALRDKFNESESEPGTTGETPPVDQSPGS